MRGYNRFMATETEEHEIKLDVGLQFALPDLNGVVDGVTEAELPRVELVASYYDTPDRRLLEHGITLRHRRDRANPGGENLWTLKLPSPSGGLAMDRTEYSWPGTPDTIPDEAIHLVRAIVRHAPLARVAQLITSRRRILVKGRGGKPLAEIDDDTVAVMDGLKLAQRFRQVEVELQAADEEVLDSVVARLVSAGATLGEPRPKVARALGQPSEREARPQPGKADLTLGQVVRAAITAAFDRLVNHDIVVRLDTDAEGVHQARVATRRLRSDLRTFRDVLEQQWTDHMRDELKWLGSALGEVRDADVLRDRLQTQATGHLTEADGQGLEELLGRLALERHSARTRLLEVLDSERYLDLLDELNTAKTAPPFRQESDPDQPARPALVPLVRRPWKKLRRAVATLGEQPSDQDLHQVRIKAKRARYAAEAAAVAVGKPARRFARAVADLQDILGAHHDAVTAEAWLRRAAEAGAVAEVFVAGQLVTFERCEQADLRRRWRSVWEAVNWKRLTAWLS
jgi:CHAD domain-containing protein